MGFRSGASGSAYAKERARERVQSSLQATKAIANDEDVYARHWILSSLSRSNRLFLAFAAWFFVSGVVYWLFALVSPATEWVVAAWEVVIVNATSEDPGLAWALSSHFTGLAMFLIIMKQQVRWVFIAGLGWLAMLWALEVTIPKDFLLWVAHSLGYSTLVVSVVLVGGLVGGTLELWRECLHFMRGVLALYPEARRNLHELPLLQQVSVICVKDEESVSRSSLAACSSRASSFDCLSKVGGVSTFPSSSSAPLLKSIPSPPCSSASSSWTSMNTPLDPPAPPPPPPSALITASSFPHQAEDLNNMVEGGSTAGRELEVLSQVSGGGEAEREGGGVSPTCFMCGSQSQATVPVCSSWTQALDSGTAPILCVCTPYGKLKNERNSLLQQLQITRRSMEEECRRRGELEKEVSELRSRQISPPAPQQSNPTDENIPAEVSELWRQLQESQEERRLAEARCTAAQESLRALEADYSVRADYLASTVASFENSVSHAENGSLTEYDGCWDPTGGRTGGSASVSKSVKRQIRRLLEALAEYSRQHDEDKAAVEEARARADQAQATLDTCSCSNKRSQETEPRPTSCCSTSHIPHDELCCIKGNEELLLRSTDDFATVNTHQAILAEQKAKIISLQNQLGSTEIRLSHAEKSAREANQRLCEWTCLGFVS